MNILRNVAIIYLFFKTKEKLFLFFIFLHSKYLFFTLKILFSKFSFNKHADVVELADTQDLGSCASACRFKSCYPHHKRATK